MRSDDPTVFWIPFRFSFDWRISFLSNNKKIMPDSSQTNTKIIDEIFDIKNVRIRMICIKIGRSFVVWIGEPTDPKADQCCWDLFVGGSDSGGGSVANSIGNCDWLTKHKGILYVSYNIARLSNDSKLKLSIDEKIADYMRSNLGE